MKHVIYFHGFASGPNSGKVLELRKHYESVFAPFIPYRFDEDVLVDQIKTFLKTNSKPGDQILFVGTSLGGYWASLMAEAFDGRAVVFNPSVDPSEDLMKYLGNNVNYSTGNPFILKEDAVKSFVKLTDSVNVYVPYAVICTKDKEVNVENAINLFENKVFIVSDDHQFKDINMFMKYVELGFSTIKSDNMWNGDF